LLGVRNVRVETSGSTCTVQDYKSIRVAVVICAILVNTQAYIDTHTQRQLLIARLYYIFLSQLC